jgi:hypothetical protein
MSCLTFALATVLPVLALLLVCASFSCGVKKQSSGRLNTHNNNLASQDIYGEPFAEEPMIDRASN